MIPDTSAGRGPTYLLKSTPKHLSRLRTGQQEVPGTSSRNGSFAQSLTFLGHNMVFRTRQYSIPHYPHYQQESKSYTDSLRPITSDSLYIHANKYHAITARKPIVHKIARKRFFSPKTPVKIHQAQKNYTLTKIPCECFVVY